NILGEVNLVVDGGLFQVVEQESRPAPAGPLVGAGVGGGVGVPVLVAGGGAGVADVIVVQGQADLLEVIPALGVDRRLASLLDRRQQQADQGADDGDHHQQLDQRKTQSHSSLRAPLRSLHGNLAGYPGRHGGITSLQSTTEFYYFV